MSGTIKDRRIEDLEQPGSWIVATDKVASGWRNGPTSVYSAYPVYDHQDVRDITQYCENRHDLVRVRHNINLPRVRDNCHLRIYDRPTRRNS